MPRTGKRGFLFYQEEVRYWIEYLGISSWDPRFAHEKDDDALARVVWSHEDGIAVFFLATIWGKKDPVSKRAISRCAFHEVCELLLGELNDLACRDTRDSIVNGAVHRVVRKLENTIFEYEWEKRQLPEEL